MSRAAYMREYRAKVKAGQGDPPTVPSEASREANGVISDLRDEVARLKRELAARPVARFDSIVPDMLPSFQELRATTDAVAERARDRLRDPMREFRPAPKPGKGR